MPQSNETIKTEFLLNTREFPSFMSTKKLNIYNAHSFKHYGSKKKTKIIIHGFQHSGNHRWIMNMTNAFLQNEDVNVIRVNWAHGARMKFYPQAAANIRMV